METNAYECKSEVSQPTDEPRSLSTSPPYSEDPQADWGLGCHDEYSPEIDYQSSIWNLSTSVPAATRDEGTGERLVLCTICHKNLVPVQEVLLVGRKKRKRQDDLPVLSSMTVCSECTTLHPEQLRHISVPEKSKRVVKRERAKTRTSESSLEKQRAQQLLAIENNKDLSESDRRRMQQMVRNRISAQQSRDRKKVYLQQVEELNEDLRNENGKLQEKIAQLEQENQYLRSQLERYMTSTGTSGSALRMSAGLVLGLAAVVMVAMVFQTQSPAQVSLQPRHLTEAAATSVMEYRKDPAVLPVAEVYDSQPVPTLLYPLLRDIRQQTVDRLKAPQLRSLPGGVADDPCKTALAREFRKNSDSITTLYCPVVQLHWGSDDKTDFDYLQILMPTDSLPISVTRSPPVAQDNYLMELLCKVTDVNMIHTEA